MRNLASLISGMVFGLGLAVSGMVNPKKIIGFLDVTGDWDPSLAFVMGGAVAVTVITFRIILKRPTPVLSETFAFSTRKNLDRRLLGGMAIFGIGWGAAGLCPGPAFSSLAFLDPKIVLFVLAMLAGSYFAKWRMVSPPGQSALEEQ